MAALNYRHLRYFQVVAHEGNLTRAAQKLNLAQSALSVQIQKLEEQIGHELFERRGRTLVLTEAGRIALDYADEIFRSGDDLLTRLSGLSTNERQALRVGAIATLSRNFQISFLNPVLQRDDVELVIHSGNLRDLLSQLEAHALDVVLCNQAPLRDSKSPWINHLISKQPLSLVGPKAIRKRRLSLEKLLAEYPVVLPGHESGIRPGVDALFERTGIRPVIAAEVDDMAMLRLVAREGMGLAILPPIVVRDELESGLLAELAVLDDVFEEFYAITLKRRFPNPLLKEVLAP